MVLIGAKVTASVANVGAYVPFNPPAKGGIAFFALLTEVAIMGLATWTSRPCSLISCKELNQFWV